MLFNSGIFLAFFTATYAAYLLLPHRRQNILLLLASYVFYGYWDYRFLTLLWLSTVVDFFAARNIQRARADESPEAAKRWLILSVCVNLGILGFFKYANFFAASFADFAGLFGVAVTPFFLDIVLPVGISFYTFQTMSYTIDVYRGRAQPTGRFLDFALFVAFFPQLMAGPIERFRRLFPQLEAPRKVTLGLVSVGGWMIFWGLFKKLFVADQLAPYTAWGIGDGNLATGLDAWVCAIAFSFRLYCDFSGYSDIAVGLGALLGFRLTQNFRIPLFASNPFDFWRRWHVTLSTWFRDYLYTPLRRALGLRRDLEIALALLVTMGLIGLWHGPSMTFIAFGLLWGLAMIAHRAALPYLAAIRHRAPWTGPIQKVGGNLLMLLVMFISAMFFAAPTMDDALHVLRLMLFDRDRSIYTVMDLRTVLYYISPLILVEIGQKLSGRFDAVLDWPWPVRTLLYTTMVALMVTAGAERAREFLYFQF